MQRRRLPFVIGALLAMLGACPSSAARAEGKAPAPVPIPYPNTSVAVDDHITKGTQGAAALRAIADAPAPAGLTASEKSSYSEYSAWVGTLSDRVGAAVAILAAARERHQKKPSPSLLKELASLDASYLSMADALLVECDKRTPVPKIMKTKHDTVKQSISNIR